MGRLALAGLLALALVWSQSLGLWHRVVHQRVSHGAPAVTVQAGFSDAARDLGLVERLFAGHRADTDCQFFDQHSHGDALTGGGCAAVVLAVLPALVLTSHALAVARWHAQFQARGPPNLR
jgi:hypothetical protein